MEEVQHENLPSNRLIRVKLQPDQIFILLLARAQLLKG